MKPLGRRGFTLVELLVVLAILAVLAGITYAATGGVRAKAREAVCISNLRQIGQALAMYRQDYAATDAPGLPSEMGFPPSPFHLIDVRRTGGGSYLGGNDDLLHCPSKIPEPEERSPQARYCDYIYGIWYPEPPTPMPPFAEAIRQRGTDFPIMKDRYHDPQRPDRPKSVKIFLVLRLDGRVSKVRVGKETTQGWQY